MALRQGGMEVTAAGSSISLRQGQAFGSALSYWGQRDIADYFVRATSGTLCAMPAASSVAPIMAGKPMQEFSMSW